jgi:hypothetical protein
MAPAGARLLLADDVQFWRASVIPSIRIDFHCAASVVKPGTTGGMQNR